jgi:adenylosuccinate synthase
MYEEYKRLSRKDLKLILHPLCPVTTPYDVEFNQLPHNLEHGSVGVGFGATIQRQEDNYKLFVQDLFYPRVFNRKLKAIRSYYAGVVVSDDVILKYLKAVDWLTKFVEIEDETFLQRDGVIYEGSQGILLDKDFGFFPNVTRSNTTSKQALMLPNHCQEVYYVTRCYQTRHGNGYMTNEVKDLGLINNDQETNTENPYQGKFRVGHLDPELLNYALACDLHYSKNLKINLVITCLDQFVGIDVETILNTLHTDFDKVFTSHGPSLTDIKQIR